MRFVTFFVADMVKTLGHRLELFGNVFAPGLDLTAYNIIKILVKNSKGF